MYELKFTKEHIEECVKTNNKKLFDEGWETFKVYNEDYIYALKIRKPYDKDEVAFNEDGYKYKQIFININSTRDYLFFLTKGYDVALLF